MPRPRALTSCAAARCTCPSPSATVPPGPRCAARQQPHAGLPHAGQLPLPGLCCAALVLRQCTGCDHAACRRPLPSRCFRARSRGPQRTLILSPTGRSSRSTTRLRLQVRRRAAAAATCSARTARARSRGGGVAAPLLSAASRLVPWLHAPCPCAPARGLAAVLLRMLPGLQPRCFCCTCLAVRHSTLGLHKLLWIPVPRPACVPWRMLLPLPTQGITPAAFDHTRLVILLPAR